MTERLDLTDKANWHPDRSPEIAKIYGYKSDLNFINAVREFRDTIEKARVTTYLGIIAARFFRTFKPPLERETQQSAETPLEPSNQ